MRRLCVALFFGLAGVTAAQEPCPSCCPLCVPTPAVIKVTRVSYQTKDNVRCYRVPTCWRFCCWNCPCGEEVQCAPVTVKTIIKKKTTCEKPTVQCQPPAPAKP